MQELVQNNPLRIPSLLTCEIISSNNYACLPVFSSSRDSLLLAHCLVINVLIKRDG